MEESIASQRRVSMTGSITWNSKKQGVDQADFVCIDILNFCLDLRYDIRKNTNTKKTGSEEQMATAIMKQKGIPEMDDVEEIISKISEESPYKRRLTQKRTWMTVPERYESILPALKNGTPIRLNIIKLPEKNQGKN